MKMLLDPDLFVKLKNPLLIDVQPNPVFWNEIYRSFKISILKGVSNQNFLGSIIHPAGNIAELMLREGFARCVDWSMGVLSSGHDKYRQAEKFAKQKQLRIWKGYAPSTANLPIKDSEFSGKVLSQYHIFWQRKVWKTSSAEAPQIVNYFLG